MNLTKVFIMSALVLSTSVFAGTEGGGGDASERRVDEIRNDILNWINKGGAANLKLEKISLEEYVRKMTDILRPKKVVVGFVEKDDPINPELQVSVNNVPKTCRGFMSKVDFRPHILCNISRFQTTSESEQYSLIHHEYAGLVEVEKNDGAASDYEISRQLVGFLEDATVKRLAIKESCTECEGHQEELAIFNKARPITSVKEVRDFFGNQLSGRWAFVQPGINQEYPYDVVVLDTQKLTTRISIDSYNFQGEDPYNGPVSCNAVNGINENTRLSYARTEDDDLTIQTTKYVSGTNKPIPARFKLRIYKTGGGIYLVGKYETNESGSSWKLQHFYTLDKNTTIVSPNDFSACQQ